MPDLAYLMIFAAIVIIIHNKICQELVPRTYMERHWIRELVFPKQHALLFRTDTSAEGGCWRVAVGDKCHPNQLSLASFPGLWTQRSQVLTGAQRRGTKPGWCGSPRPSDASICAHSTWK